MKNKIFSIGYLYFFALVGSFHVVLVLLGEVAIDIYKHVSTLDTGWDIFLLIVWFGVFIGIACDAFREYKNSRR